MFVVLIFQLFVRGEALVCNEQWFPPPGSCQTTDNVPVGTVVAFFGPESKIPEGWKVCDGKTIDEELAWGIDADRGEDGTQLPDLRNRFIRGSFDDLKLRGIEVGGKDEIEFEHAHLWASINNHRWFTYDENNERFRVDDWNNGHDDEGNGEKPLKSRNSYGTLDFYTMAESQTIKTIPQYAELRYIIKVR